jgi:cytoskeletal protein CcmA (bactofilin family)
MNDGTRERVGLWIAMMAVLLMALLVLASGECPGEAVQAAPLAQSLAGVVVLEDGTTLYDEDAETDYLVNRYYSEVDLFLSVDVSETTNIVPAVQHSPDGVTWYAGESFTTVTTDSTAYQMLRAPFYGEYMRVAFDITGDHEYTPTLKLVPRRACDGVETVVLDDGATAYDEDHESSYEVVRSGIVDLFVGADVSGTVSVAPAVQHSPDGVTWYAGESFTTVTTDTTAYQMLRVPLYGEYIRVAFDTVSDTYTPTVKATFHTGCELSAYEELRAELYLANDEDGDLLTRSQADGRYLNATGDEVTDLEVTDDLIVGDDGDVRGDLLANTVTVTETVSAEQLTSTDDLSVAGDGDVDGTLTANAVMVTGTVSAEQLTSTDDATVTDALAVGGDLTAGTATVAGDVTISAESSGGNAEAKNELVGLPRIQFIALGTGTDGTTETVAYIDADPTGEWAEIDAGDRITVTADTTIYRHTTNSLKIEFTTVYTGEGVDGTIVQDDLSGDDSLGFWIYATEALAGADFALTLDDTDGTDQSYNLPAVSAAVWTWVELDISGCDANCNTVDGVQVLATAQGAGNLGAVDIYLDGMMKWAVGDEVSLGVDILQDGVLNIITMPTLAASDNEFGVLAENTDFFVAYRDGVDGLVWITDQSAVQALAFVAY